MGEGGGETLIHQPYLDRRDQRREVSCEGPGTGRCLTRPARKARRQADDNLDHLAICAQPRDLGEVAWTTTDGRDWRRQYAVRVTAGHADPYRPDVDGEPNT